MAIGTQYDQVFIFMIPTLADWDDMVDVNLGTVPSTPATFVCCFDKQPIAKGFRYMCAHVPVSYTPFGFEHHTTWF